MAWSTVAASTRAKRDAQIPVAWRVPETEIASLNPLHGIPFIESRLTARELEITNWTATEALKKIHSGEISSYEVTSAICHRAALAHAVTNCLTEIFFDEALERAKKLDAEFEKNGRKPIGPLHGLPVSIKEEFDLPGKLTTWLVAYKVDNYVYMLYNPFSLKGLRLLGLRRPRFATRFGSPHAPRSWRRLVLQDQRARCLAHLGIRQLPLEPYV